MIEPQDTERLIELLRQRYPGWEGFDHPEFVREEIEYKQAGVELAKKDLNETDLRRLLAEENYQEIISRLDKLGKHNNLLFRGVPMKGDLGILYQESLDKGGFCAAVVNLLYGSGSSPVRLQEYVDWVESQGLPNKWTFPTYLLFFVHPESEMFIAPNVAKEVLRVLGREGKYRGKPDGKKYQEYLGLMAEAREAFAAYNPRNMIDIQSLLYVCSDVNSQPAPERKESEPVPIPDPIASSDYFSRTTFELLDGIHDNPTQAYYAEHKEEFKAHIQNPFRALFEKIVSHLDESMTQFMESEKKVFGRFSKNDWGRGGAWDFYWGALYPKGGNRVKDAQLYVWINHEILTWGFGLGSYSGESKERMVRNAKDHKSYLLPQMEESLPSETVIFAALSNDGLQIDPDGTDPVTWEQYFESLADITPQVSRRLSPEEVLAKDPAELAAEIAEMFMALFPMALLATESDPTDAIQAIHGSVEESEENEEYSLEECSRDTGISLEQLDRWVRAIHRKGQGIFYGPPGTGKTYIAQHLARHLIGGGLGFSDLVQFHPAYSYEDFIQGIRPKTGVDGSLTYEMKAGRFVTFCRRAAALKDPCVLIIDEINRANLARVFGELMYLLEYRGETIPLAGGETLRIPKNVRIIGTMNTADRSIALVDHALRRRFAFLSLKPQYGVMERYHDGNGYEAGALVELLREVNNQINDPHYEVGITFFLRKDIEVQLEDIWRMEIEPYLEEYFFDQPDKVDLFRWASVRDRLSR